MITPYGVAINDAIAKGDSNKLQKLVDQGVLTPDEFAAAKQKLISG